MHDMLRIMAEKNRARNPISAGGKRRYFFQSALGSLEYVKRKNIFGTAPETGHRRMASRTTFLSPVFSHPPSLPFPFPARAREVQEK